MRRRKLLSVFGAVTLTVASVAGCKSRDVKETTTQETPKTTVASAAVTDTTAAVLTQATEGETTLPEAEAIDEDEQTIRSIVRVGNALLADETFFTDADETVEVIVKVENKKADITVTGVHLTVEKFILETNTALTGQMDGKVDFLSDSFEGSTTVLTYKYDPDLYAWSCTVANDVKLSKYYDKDFQAPSVTNETTGEEPTKDAKGGVSTIHVWSYSTEVPNMIKKYVDTHPEFSQHYRLKYTIVTTDNGAYEAALDETLLDKDEEWPAPELYVAESDFVKKYTTGSASGYACTYEELGINVEKGILDGQIAAYTADVTRRSDGKVVALGYLGNGCAFIYNRKVAADVFGDDKPSTIEAALGRDWDSFFEAAERCKAKGYAIVSGLNDIWHPVENSAEKGWIVDGKLYIDPRREAFLDLAKTLYVNDYTNDTLTWMEGWFADIAEVGPKKVLGFYGPKWLLDYTFTDNCGYLCDEDGTVYNNGTFGDWAVCRPNYGSFWGGAWLIANKKALEDENIKNGVRELIEYITLDTSESGLQYEWANATFTDDPDRDGYGTHHSVASRKIMKKTKGVMDLLGGQDAFPYFMAADEMARGDNLTEYDREINSMWLNAVRNYAYGYYTREEVLRQFKGEVKTNVNGISVD